ncbi:MAG: mannose-1-phosphate guanylyltransferase [Candidatus Limnocylindrales bacterium]
MYAVIMAGGGGTRLWPLSSPERPKPFLPLLGDRTLLQLSADRLSGLVPPESVFVVTDRRYEDLVRAQLPQATILSEPQGRNTAAAIALATVAIDRPDDEVMLVLPADQTVEKPDLFVSVLSDAESELALGSFGLRDPLVTLGVQTTRPATEYGYLIPDLEQRQQLHLDAFRLKAFQEKPTREHAELLLKQPGVAWNAGMFMWRRRAIRAALEAFAPAVFEGVALAFGAGTLDEGYATVESISIDYAVMEPAAAAGKVVMGSMDVGWNDLGSWTSLLGELGLPGIEASIARPGDPLESGDDDLLIWRPEPQRLTSTPGADARMVGSNRPVAVLRGARPQRFEIDALLERCSSPEAQA